MDVTLSTDGSKRILVAKAKVDKASNFGIGIIY